MRTRGGTLDQILVGDKLQQAEGCKDCGDAATSSRTKVGQIQANPFGLTTWAAPPDHGSKDCWHKTYQGAPQ